MSDAAEQWEEYRLQHLNQLYQLLDAAGDGGVSDLHVVPDTGVAAVREGVLRRTTNVFAQQDIIEWLRRPRETGAPLTDARLGDAGHVSVAFDTGRYRARGAFRRSTDGVSVTFRIISHTIPNVDDVGVPPQIQSLMSKAAGLILVQGPTNSGKTTSIAGLIDKVNREQDKHVVLIEDPIEFVHKPVGNTVFTQREVGEHVSDYTAAVESALRSAPNVILVGELLNPATTRAALHAATTGHLVITTAHAGSVTEAIDSFIGQFTADEQPQIRSRLAQSLLAVMVQKLVPGTDGKRHAAREVLMHNRNFQELIKDGEIHMIHQQLTSGESTGSFTLEDSLVNLVRSGAITIETAMSQAREPATLREELERLGYKA